MLFSLPWRKQLLEQFFIFTCTKPGFDAWRFLKHEEQHVGEIVNAQYTMTTTRVCEILGESIPSVIIQMSAILHSEGDTDVAAIFMLISSLSAAAFISALISFDWDTEESQRKSNPAFYGYVINTKVRKVSCFILLFCLSFFNLAVRGFACVLLLTLGTSVAVLTFGSELLFFLMFKTISRDFTYHLPFDNLIIRTTSSFLIRVVVKIVADWTSIVQFRHPCEIG